jgi:glycosyltransferase involved in cell wall biosynthesis
VQNYLPAAGTKTLIIPHCIDVLQSRKSATTSLPVHLQQFLNDHQGKCIVTMIGRDDPVKNYPLALAAARILLTKSSHYVFVCVGISRTSVLIGKLLEDFPHQVLTLDSLDNVPALLRQCTVLLISSKKESSSLVSMETFAQGKPVIATNVPGLRDVVENGRNGLLCAENPEALSAAIETIFADRVLYERFRPMR